MAAEGLSDAGVLLVFTVSAPASARPAWLLPGYCRPVCFGKVIGGGFPGWRVRRPPRLMDHVKPEDASTSQTSAPTLSVAAGLHPGEDAGDRRLGRARRANCEVLRGSASGFEACGTRSKSCAKDRSSIRRIRRPVRTPAAIPARNVEWFSLFFHAAIERAFICLLRPTSGFVSMARYGILNSRRGSPRRGAK